MICLVGKETVKDVVGNELKCNPCASKGLKKRLLWATCHYLEHSIPYTLRLTPQHSQEYTLNVLNIVEKSSWLPSYRYNKYYISQYWTLAAWIQISLVNWKWVRYSVECRSGMYARPQFTENNSLGLLTVKRCAAHMFNPMNLKHMKLDQYDQ